LVSVGSPKVLTKSLQTPLNPAGEKLTGGKARVVGCGAYPVVRVFRPEEHTSRYRRNEDESRPS
jgi:hypothetical protein